MLKKEADKLKKEQLQTLASTQVDCKEPTTDSLDLFEKICICTFIFLLLAFLF